MTTQPDGPEDALAEAVRAVDDGALRAMMREEIGRLDPAARVVVARRLRERSEYHLREARRDTEAAPAPQVVVADPVPPARKVLLFIGACALALGFVGFWYGMIFGAPHHSTSAG